MQQWLGRGPGGLRNKAGSGMVPPFYLASRVHIYLYLKLCSATMGLDKPSFVEVQNHSTYSLCSLTGIWVQDTQLGDTGGMSRVGVESITYSPNLWLSFAFTPSYHLHNGGVQ